MTSFLGRRYEVDAKLSEGAFGVVLRVRCASEPGAPPLAAKVFEEEEWVSLSDDEEETTASPTALRELSFMQALTAAAAPRCVPLLDFDFALGDYLALVLFMPLYAGDLSDALRDERLDAAQRLAVGCDVLRALAFLHGCSPPVAHRDVKPENVLLDEKRRGFLTDFSFACFAPRDFRMPPARPERRRRSAPRRPAPPRAALLRCGGRLCRRGRAGAPSSSSGDSESSSSSSSSDPEHSGVLGTTTYLAPEVLEGAFPHASADAWAAGVLLLELLEHARLDADSDEEALRLLRKKRARLDEGLLLQRLVRGLLQEDPLRRLAAADALAQLRAAGLQAAAEDPEEPPPAVFADRGPAAASPEVEALCRELRAVNPETARAAELYRREAPELDARALAVIAAKVHEHRPRSDEGLVASAGVDVDALEEAQEALLRRLGGGLLARRPVVAPGPGAAQAVPP
jgi:serine/threonine protein kinase